MRKLKKMELLYTAAMPQGRNMRMHFPGTEQGALRAYCSSTVCAAPRPCRGGRNVQSTFLAQNKTRFARIVHPQFVQHRGHAAVAGMYRVHSWHIKKRLTNGLPHS